jgi:hypothetical protein
VSQFTEATRGRGVFTGMASLQSDITLPLTLSDQLNAMLLGWLDRHAPDGDLGDATQVAAGVITVASSAVAEIEAFCAGWDMTVQRSSRGDGRWEVIVVQGRPLPVRGFVEITTMYRR